MEKNACLICFFKRTFALWVFARVWQLFNWLFLLTHVLSIKCNGSRGKFKYQFYVLIKPAIPQAAINCGANIILTAEFVLLEFWTSDHYFLFIVGVATPPLRLRLGQTRCCLPPVFRPHSTGMGTAWSLTLSTNILASKALESPGRFSGELRGIWILLVCLIVSRTMAATYPAWLLLCRPFMPHLGVRYTPFFGPGMCWRARVQDMDTVAWLCICSVCRVRAELPIFVCELGKKLLSHSGQFYIIVCLGS